MQKIICFLLISLLVVVTQPQSVDCIKYINSSYASPTSCQSTSADNRPINATAYVRCSKNTTWYGIDDWNPYIVRDKKIVRDLFWDESNCFTA